MHEHKPVLLEEAIKGLNIKPDGIYIDGTFGRGGHSQEILKHLNQDGGLIAIDKDPEAINIAKEKFANDKRFSIEQGSFTQIKAIAQAKGITNNIAGILLDIGVSSPQLDDPSRGFSFLLEGPLDMRMDPSRGIDAATWINAAKAEDIAKVLKEYGEERFAKRIARAIVEAREKQAITTTTELAEIVKQANPKWEKHKHPATRSFQAIRIYINQELEELKTCLEQCIEVLAVGGRLAVISFHSLEDRIVKRFIKQQITGGIPAQVPVTEQQMGVRFRKIGGAIKATTEEVAANVRARSAVLRIMEKIQ